MRYRVVVVASALLTAAYITFGHDSSNDLSHIQTINYCAGATTALKHIFMRA